jgi:glucose-1-phosphate thymidylyltransferase
MWGIIPAAGRGSRIQPLAFSKELLPVGARAEAEMERPRAVSEYLVERLTLGGATRVCFVIAPGKSDILEYFGGDAFSAAICYTVQPQPLGLCDAVFRALPLIHPSETVMVGLPDTLWFPENALTALPDDILSFLLFPVSRPELFDAVETDEQGRVLEIQVKQPGPSSRWVWGAFKMPAQVLRELYDLWCERDRSDEYIGTLVNAYMKRGGEAAGVCAGTCYVDVGTLEGYREAMRLLNDGAGRARSGTAQRAFSGGTAE